MPNLTGAFRLIWKHTVCHRKWDITTTVVLVYLLVSIVGRLSVAAFGLTYDLNEQPGLEYPIKITDWHTSEWFNESVSDDYELLDQHVSESTI
jgi:hypothetical protein